VAKPAGQRSANSQASAEQVMKLLELLDIRESLQITIDAMKEQIASGAEEGLREKISAPTPEQIKSVHGIVDDVFKDLVLDDFIKDVVPVYQKHLTQHDVNAAIAFYSSATGRKITREQPAMMRESMAATSAGQQKKLELLLARLELRMQQFIEGEKNNSGTEKKQ
jgi:hypothetical protein